MRLRRRGGRRLSPDSVRSRGAADGTGCNCVVVCGPTASGKTRLAVQIARAVGGEILSADSRQVYRGMDIGTGKDLHEYNGRDDGGHPVPCHLIDIADPAHIYTLYDYQQDFYKAFEDVSARGRLPVAAGGSGLYIEAVIKGYEIPAVPENIEFRRSMMGESRETLTRMLRDESPQIFARTDTGTKKRVIRALEVARFGTAVTAPAVRADGADTALARRPAPVIDPLILYVTWERAALRRRIEERLRERIENGLIEEAAGLMNAGIDPERFALFGMEYKHAARCVNGDISRDEMIAQLLQDIYRLAKRQDTWFRGMTRRGLTTHTIPQSDFNTAITIVNKYISNA